MTGSGSLGVVHDDLEAGSAAAAAVASGEKKEVALLPALKEELSSRKAEVTNSSMILCKSLKGPIEEVFQLCSTHSCLHL